MNCLDESCKESIVSQKSYKKSICGEFRKIVGRNDYFLFARIKTTHARFTTTRRDNLCSKSICYMSKKVGSFLVDIINLAETVSFTFWWLIYSATWRHQDLFYFKKMPEGYKSFLECQARHKTVQKRMEAKLEQALKKKRRNGQIWWSLLWFCQSAFQDI